MKDKTQRPHPRAVIVQGILDGDPRAIAFAEALAAARPPRRSWRSPYPGAPKQLLVDPQKPIKGGAK